MSRIGKKPIAITSGAEVSIQENVVTVKGPKGTLTQDFRSEVAIAIEGGDVVVTRNTETRQARALHGLYRSLVQNMIVGVTEGYVKELEIVGVGWGAKIVGKEIELSLGYADKRMVGIPQGIDVELTGNQKIKISGCDKQLVGQVAAEARAHRKPEPYNGKGVRYKGEQIIRKEGKAFGK